MSAVVGLSDVGRMTNGPYIELPNGDYIVDCYLRSPVTTADFGSVVVQDDVSGYQVSKSVTLIPYSNQWVVVSQSFTVSSTPNQMEYSFVWNGNANVDLAFIRVRQ